MMEYFMGDITLKEPETYEIVDVMSGVIAGSGAGEVCAGGMLIHEHLGHCSIVL